MNQPIPEVNKEDVERIVRRDYPEEKYNEIFEMLNEYGIEDWERETIRVHLAILKLSNKDFYEIHKCVDIAKKDYRDVLLWAEYPLCGKQKFWNLNGKEKQEIYKKDWKQYQEWLTK